MAFTLEDVGRHCGVSRSTVSRVINNSPLVNEATKERVLKAIRELKYAPNLIARSLTTNRTQTLAVALPDITGGVFPEILAGMDEVASQRGYRLLVVFMGGERPRSDAVEELIAHRRVDGIVTVAGTIDDKDLVRMAEGDVALVCIARRSPVSKVPSVLFDDAGGALEATRLLLAQGRKQLVHIRGPEGNFDAQERRRGFQTALREAGIAFEPQREIAGDFRREIGVKAMRDFLKTGIAFDGIFAANDETAIAAIEVLNEKGVAIPREVAIVGFDDIESARFIGLSTVHIPTRESGRVAARMAFDLIDGKKSVDSHILATEVVQRASSMVGSAGKPIMINKPQGR
ncbi:MAG: LacI family DNA-binding transcriptional regulator [Verrucomicrobiota bacterium]